MTYYTTLELTRDATQEEIKRAYRRLVLETHPDKIPNQEERFIAVLTAYKVLNDPRKRKVYDGLLDYGLEEEPQSIEKAFPLRRPYRLLYEPYNYNHYEFINIMFVQDKEHEDYLTPGQTLTDWDKNRLWWQLHEITGVLYAENTRLSRQRVKSAEDKERIKLLTHNEKKMGQVMNVLTCEGQEKLLYDLSLGPEVVQPTAEMREIEVLIGGRERLIEHIKVHPELYTSGGVFALREVNCLNPANFEKLIEGRDKFQFFNIYTLLDNLLETKLLTQSNFDFLMANKQHSHPISNGVDYLAIAGLLNQSFFEEIVLCGKDAETVGSALKTLNEFNLLNDMNRQRVIRLAKKTDIDLLLDNSFLSMEQQGLLTAEKGEALQWTGTKALHPLSLRIDEMFAYGLYLLNHDTAKAETAMLLALDLKNALRTFFAKPLAEQVRLQHEFKTEFMQLLRSKNKVMAEHRAYWKVIVANIAIALTGIGLLALGAYYLHSGQCFFAKTQREKLRDAIKQDAWLQEGEMPEEMPNENLSLNL